MSLNSAQKVAETRWRGMLDDDERVVAATAEHLHDVLPAFGATYRAAFFLKNYLANAHGVGVTVTVGFVNDGEDEVYRSHAWVTFNGQVTDLALSKFEGALEGRRGPLVVQGFELKPGDVAWRYFPARPEGGRIAVQELAPEPGDAAGMEHAEEIHAYMANVAKDSGMIRAYLDQAPDGLTYEVLAGRM